MGQVYSYYYIAFCFPVPKGTVVLVHQYIVFLEACEPVVFMVYKHVGQVDLYYYIAFSFPVKGNPPLLYEYIKLLRKSHF